MRQPHSLGIFENPDGLSDWLNLLRVGRLAVDTEHTGFHWERDRIGGLCLAAGTTAIYTCKDAIGPAARWLGDQIKNQRSLIFHAAKGDLHQLRSTFGINVSYPVDDTLVMSFLLDNRGAFPENAKKRKGRHELKRLAARFVDPCAEEPEEALRQAVVAAGGRQGKNDWKGDLLMASVELVGEYGALDAWFTLQLGEQFLERLRYWPQPDGYPELWSLYETERWLILALRDMEHRGILVRAEFFEEWEKKLERKIKRLYRSLRKMAGRDLNWNSPPQLRELLYNELDLDPTRWTPGGVPSTDEVALLNLDHPIGAELLKLRDANKQHSTYARGLLKAIWDDGRIHANFKGTGARTGRLSCEDPNLQQVPRESGARRGFIPDKGLALRFADYSQIEMRFAAHLSNDPTLVHGFIHDPDFDTHEATAIKMFGTTGPSKRQRKFAKMQNFANLFGAGEDKVTNQLISLVSPKEARQALREMSYTPKTGESSHRALAKLLRKRYFKEFPAVKGARYDEQRAVEQRGFAMNVFGRHRYLDSDETYKAFNTAIQGSAADQAKRGLVALYRELQINEGSIALLLQIHDEAVYLSDGDPRTDRKVLELLNDESTFRIPIVANVSGSTKSWQDKEEIQL